MIVEDTAPAIPVAPQPPIVEIDADGTFPLDAFIIPEDARRIPAGFSASGEEENLADGAVRKMAETLERLAMDLRRDGPDALARQITSTDALESLLAAALSDFVNRQTA